mgnify:FL=1
MHCPLCDRENADTSSFCIYCGAELHNVEDEADTLEIGPDAPEQQRVISGLTRDVRQLQREMRQVLSILSRQDDTAVTRQPVSPGPTVEMRPTPEAPVSEPSLWDRVDWEPIVGGNWLARIGVVAIVIGTAFFLKLAFDNNWIGEPERVVLGILGGLAFLGASQYWLRRYPVYAQALAGGGIGILYLSIFSAFVLFSLIGFYPAVGLLLLISCISAALALRHDSLALALIGIAGALMAPFILSGFAEGADAGALTGQSLHLIAYIIAVDLGVLVLSTFKNWRWLTLMALVGSLAAYGAWYAEYSDTVGHLTSQGSITIIFLIFVAATTLFHFVWRRAPKAYDFTLMVATASAYFGISYGLLWNDFRDWMGGFTLLLSLFYGGIAYLALLRIREHVNLALMSLAIALVFLTIAVPVELDRSWIAVAWSTQGTVLVWLSFRLRMWKLRASGLCVFAVLAVRVLAFDTTIDDLGDFQVILNSRMLAFASAITALYLAAYLVRRGSHLMQEQQSGGDDESGAVGADILSLPSNLMDSLRELMHSRLLFPGLLVTANFLTVWILSAEVIATVDSDVVDMSREAEPHVKSLSLSLLWGLYASVMLIIGIVRRWQPVRLGGLALLAIPVAKLFVVDTFELEQGYRIVAYFSLGFILLAGGLLYQRYSEAIKRFLFEEQAGGPA